MPEDPGGGKRGSDSHRDQTPDNVPSSGEDEAGGTTGTGEQPHPAHGSPEHGKN